MDIKLEFTIEEVNIILDALGQQSFKDVFEVIDKIQQQAGEQINASTAPLAADGDSRAE